MFSPGYEKKRKKKGTLFNKFKKKSSSIRNAASDNE